MNDPSKSSLASLVSSRAVLQLHDQSTASWHGDPVESFALPSEFLHTVLDLHRANFELWHIEDQARAPEASDRQIAETKRAIDRTNQRRNDLSEQCDHQLLAALVPHALPRPDADLHSESPGLMLDRLSILALKIYHTREEIERPNAPEGHAHRNRQRLALLESQRADLAACLDTFWARVLAGEQRFKVYRQLKMYNDPALNPAVYQRKPSS
jgi:hypothetical protein